MTEQLPKYIKYYGYTLEQVRALKAMTYDNALTNKIDSAKSLLSRLVNKPIADRDFSRIDEVSKAIKFNQELLEELKI